MVSEDFFYYEAIGANGPQVVAIWDPRGMVGRVHLGEHQALQQL